MDHGFWQFSPDLFRTFYRAAGFKIATSALYVLAPEPFAFNARENIYRTRGRQFIVENLPAALLIFAAQKERNVFPITVRLQDYYNDRANEAGEMFFVELVTQPAARPTILARLRQTRPWALLRRIRTLIQGRAA